ncbi:MAG: hypothetical protein AB8G05_08265 [Oligoflexales bacterium]
MKFKNGQQLSVSDNTFTIVGQFQSDCVFFMSKVAQRSQKKLLKTRKQFNVPLPSPCRQTSIDAGDFILIKPEKNWTIRQGKLFRFDQYDLATFKPILLYKAKVEHCLIAIKICGSLEKKDMVVQLTNIIPSGNYVLIRIMN